MPLEGWEVGLGRAVGMEELRLWMGLTQSLAAERP